MSPQDEFLTVRVDPDLKSALQAAAEREGRSVSNMIKHVLRLHFGGDPQFIGVQSPVSTYKVARKKKK